MPGTGSRTQLVNKTDVALPQRLTVQERRLGEEDEKRNNETNRKNNANLWEGTRGDWDLPCDTPPKPSLTFSQTCQPPENHLVHLRVWFCPQDAQRQMNPGGLCKEGAEEMRCYPSWETAGY